MDKGLSFCIGLFRCQEMHPSVCRAGSGCRILARIRLYYLHTSITAPTRQAFSRSVFSAAHHRTCGYWPACTCTHTAKVPASTCTPTAEVPDPAHPTTTLLYLCPRAASLPGVAVALGSPPLGGHPVDGGEVLRIQLEREHPLVVRDVARVARPHDDPRHLQTPRISSLYLRFGCPRPAAWQNCARPVMLCTYNRLGAP